MSLRHVKSGFQERLAHDEKPPKRSGGNLWRRRERSGGRRNPPGPVFLAMTIGAVGGLVAASLFQSSSEKVVVAEWAEDAPADSPETALLAPSGAEQQPAPPVESAGSAAAPTMQPDAPAAIAPPPAASIHAIPKVQKRTITDRIRAGETLSVALSRHGVELEAVHHLASQLRGKLDLRAIRPGDVYTVEEIVCGQTPKAPCTGTERESKTASLALDRFEFKPASFIGAPYTIRATRQVDVAAEGSPSAASVRYTVEREETPVETRVSAMGGEISSSLYVSMIAQGEDSNLVNRFVDVFAWDIDFYRETQKGDRYKVIVEKQYAAGRFIGYGRVLAAEYVNAGKVHRGFNFKSDDGRVTGIFDENGQAMEKTFLKNPLEIARITSSYGQRFHPVLRRQKKHNGVDYGASRGTPFWAVADGVVKEARYSPTAGNMVVLRHANGFETEYFHASRFAKGLREGQKVRQREVIGFVGNTGRSTGPHLHFGMRRRGAYVDPGRQSFPAARPVPQTHLQEYLRLVKPLLAEIEALEIS